MLVYRLDFLCHFLCSSETILIYYLLLVPFPLCQVQIYGTELFFYFVF